MTGRGEGREHWCHQFVVGVPLSADEEQISASYQTARRLGAALQRTPLNRALLGELAAFVDGPGWRACDALDRLLAGTAAARADRMTALLRGEDEGRDAEL